MLELIPKFPPHVLAISASGQVTANDYENVLIPTVESMLKQHPTIRIFYHLGPKFTEFSMGAMWDDAKLGIDHFKAWEKIAIITDKTWIKSVSDIFNIAIPCPIKVFANKDYAEAEVWITN
jgi:hypothetical protein